MSFLNMTSKLIVLREDTLRSLVSEIVFRFHCTIFNGQDPLTGGAAPPSLGCHSIVGVVVYLLFFTRLVVEVAGHDQAFRVAGEAAVNNGNILPPLVRMVLFGRGDGNFGGPCGNRCIVPPGQSNQSNRKRTERVAQYGA